MSPVEGALQFNQLTREGGLPPDGINAIMQDSRGFMWFGTEDGPVRYDGYELKVYKNDLNDHQSLNSNKVTVIYEDRADILWIGTSIGLNKYNRNTETFKSYRSNLQLLLCLCARKGSFTWLTIFLSKILVLILSGHERAEKIGIPF